MASQETWSREGALEPTTASPTWRPSSWRATDPGVGLEGGAQVLARECTSPRPLGDGVEVVLPLEHVLHLPAVQADTDHAPVHAPVHG